MDSASLSVGDNVAVSSSIIRTNSGSDLVDINVVKTSGEKSTIEAIKGEAVPPVICPHVNCPEKIVICLDLNDEMHTTIFRSRAGDKYSGLELAKRAIRMFVQQKSQMNPRHEFAFLVFHEESTMIQPLTKNPKDIFQTLDETDMASQQSGPLNLEHMFQTLQSSVSLPSMEGDPAVVPPAFIVRALLVYGRSHSVPVQLGSQVQKELEVSPHFFTDVLYIHEPPAEDNKCEDIFQSLCELDHNGLSYIFEECKYTPILNSGAKLLAHPLQRAQQLQAAYKIGGAPLANQSGNDERTV